MRRRVISLFLAVAVLCSCMTVTVGASEVEMQQLINVLEFDTVNGSGNYYLTGSKGAASASFSLPYGTLVRYIDMYISTNNQAFESINWEVNGTDFPLTVEEVYGSTYYRVYGQVSGGYTDTIKLDFKWVNSGNYKLQFYSLHVSAQTFSGHSAPSTLTLDTWEKLSATQETGTSSVMLVSTAGSTGNGITIGVSDFLIGVHNSDWQKYDRMNFTFMVSAATVNNITCTISNQLVPCEISFVEGTLPSYDSFWVEGSDGENSVFYEMSYFLLHRHRHADIVIFTQQWDALDRKIRCITDRVYYVRKGWLLGKWITSMYRVPYGIMFPDGEKKGEIIQGYYKPPFLNRLFARRIFRPRYYKYFDSFALDPLDELPADRIAFETDTSARPVFRYWLRASGRYIKNSRRRLRRYRRAEEKNRKVLFT